MGIRATIVADCDRFPTPYEFRAALAESLPAANRLVGWAAVRRAVPALHRLYRESITCSSDRRIYRLSQRGIRCGQNLIIARNLDTEVGKVGAEGGDRSKGGNLDEVAG